MSAIASSGCAQRYASSGSKGRRPTSGSSRHTHLCRPWSSPLRQPRRPHPTCVSHDTPRTGRARQAPVRQRLPRPARSAAQSPTAAAIRPLWGSARAGSAAVASAPLRVVVVVGRMGWQGWSGGKGGAVGWSGGKDGVAGVAWWRGWSGKGWSGGLGQHPPARDDPPTQPATHLSPLASAPAATAPPRRRAPQMPGRPALPSTPRQSLQGSREAAATVVRTARRMFDVRGATTRRCEQQAWLAGRLRQCHPTAAREGSRPGAHLLSVHLSAAQQVPPQPLHRRPAGVWLGRSRQLRNWDERCISRQHKPKRGVGWRAGAGGGSGSNAARAAGCAGNLHTTSSSCLLLCWGLGAPERLPGTPRRRQGALLLLGRRHRPAEQIGLGGAWLGSRAGTVLRAHCGPVARPLLRCRTRVLCQIETNEFRSAAEANIWVGDALRGLAAGSGSGERMLGRANAA